MKIKNQKLVSQSEAARIAGVSRQAVGSLKNKSGYNFFVDKKVDVNHQDWEIYLHERKGNGKGNVEKPAEKKSKSKSKPPGSKKKLVAKSKPKPEPDDQLDPHNQDDIINFDFEKNPFTGGVSPSHFAPKGTADMKRFVEIAKLKLEIEKNLGTYIDREMLLPYLDEIGKAINAYMVNLPRKLSSRICKALQRVGMEKKVEKIMAPYIAKAIQEVKVAALKAGKVK